MKQKHADVEFNRDEVHTAVFNLRSELKNRLIQEKKWTDSLAKFTQFAMKVENPSVFLQERVAKLVYCH